MFTKHRARSIRAEQVSVVTNVGRAVEGDKAVHAHLNRVEQVVLVREVVAKGEVDRSALVRAQKTCVASAQSVSK